MATEGNDKKSNRLQVWLIVLVIVSMGLNVYLFRYYAEQDDGVEVMTSWADANTQIHKELTSVKAMLADLEARQSAQDTTTKEIYETLVQVDDRQVAQNSASAAAPTGLDKESWEVANTEIHEVLASVQAVLTDLEARQSAQETTTKEIHETLVLVDNRQAAQDSASAAASEGLDKESWEAANAQIQEELSAIKAMLDQILVQNEKEIAAALEPDFEIEFEDSIQVMASAPELAYEQQAGHDYPIAIMRLLPGDTVWSIVARFKPSPSPTLVDRVVEFNKIADPRRLPVGFPVRVPLDLVNDEL